MRTILKSAGMDIVVSGTDDRYYARSSQGQDNRGRMQGSACAQIWSRGTNGMLGSVTER